MRPSSCLFCCILIFQGALSVAQTVQVSRTNKTITVTADERVVAPAEVATVKVGYHAFGATKDAAFHDTVEVSNRIVKALLGAGLREGDLETADIVLDRLPMGTDEGVKPDMTHSRQFGARQTFRFRISADSVQSFVNAAVQAGANEVENPEWDVADPAALEMRATAAALLKARKVAERMAADLGAHLGELVYASNQVPSSWESSRGAAPLMLATPPPVVTPQLKIFPAKVSSEATVYAVFAIE